MLGNEWFAWFVLVGLVARLLATGNFWLFSLLSIAGASLLPVDWRLSSAAAVSAHAALMLLDLRQIQHRSQQWKFFSTPIVFVGIFTALFVTGLMAVSTGIAAVLISAVLFIVGSLALWLAFHKRLFAGQLSIPTGSLGVRAGCGFSARYSASRFSSSRFIDMSESLTSNEVMDVTFVVVMIASVVFAISMGGVLWSATAALLVGTFIAAPFIAHLRRLFSKHLGFTASAVALVSTAIGHWLA